MSQPLTRIVKEPEKRKRVAATSPWPLIERFGAPRATSPTASLSGDLAYDLRQKGGPGTSEIA